MHCSHIRSNVKGGVDVELAPKTLIVGPNASQKTAITQSVELALSGKVSDLVGRDLTAREADLIALAPGRTGDLYAIAEFTSARVDGTAAVAADGNGERVQAEYHIASKAEGKASRAKHTLPVKVAFPLRDVREALLGSADTARKFFLSRTAGVVVRADVLERLDPQLHGLYEQTAQVFLGAEIDRLLQVLAHAGRRAREVAGEAKTARVAATTLGAGLPAEPTVAQVQQAEERVRTIQSIGCRKAKLDSLRDRAVNAVEVYKAAEAEAIGAEQRAAAFGAGKSDQLYRLQALHLLCFATGAEDTTCFLCQGPLPSKGYLLNIGQQAAAALERHKVAISAATLAEARRAEADRRKAEAIRLATELKEAEAEDTAEGAAFVDANGETTAIAELSRLQQVKTTWEKIRELEAAAREHDAGEAAWKDLASALKDVVATLLDAAIEAFRRRVQEFLPAYDTFDLRLREGEREVFQMGLLHGGDSLNPAVLYTALSGAEWARVTAAVACACHVRGALNVVIPEERAFDPVTLRAVLVALAKAPGQVIVTSPIKPAGRIPKGWTLLEVDAVAVRAESAAREGGDGEGSRDDLDSPIEDF